MAADRGARVIGGDNDEAGLDEVSGLISKAGGIFLGDTATVSVADNVRRLVNTAVESFQAVDVMINNTGVMPLAFFADHAMAATAWDRCIDVNIKGVLHGITAVYDHMVARGHGHVVNVSSIYGQFPVAGARCTQRRRPQ